MGVRLELEDLPPRYRAQAEMQIAERKKRAGNGRLGQSCPSSGPAGPPSPRGEGLGNGRRRQGCPSSGPAGPPSPTGEGLENAPESEKRYYREVILPKVACGLVVKVQEQIVFELLPEKAYCGLKLPKARYKPDFVLTYADGTVEIVEVKSRFTRRMQRDYIYRRRLFIDLVAEPRGWKFTEWYADKED